jgi:hypothetical protein
MSYIDKRTNSTGYRRKVKKLTEIMKAYRGLQKIPGLPRKLKSSVSPRELADHNDSHRYRIDRSTIHYFLFPMEGGSDRRSQATTSAPETSTAV